MTTHPTEDDQSTATGGTTVTTDPQLSFKARGLFHYLDNPTTPHRMPLQDLYAAGPDRRDAIRNALAELETAGYLERRVIAARGRNACVEWILRSERPAPVALPDDSGTAVDDDSLVGLEGDAA